MINESRKNSNDIQLFAFLLMRVIHWPAMVQMVTSFLTNRFCSRSLFVVHFIGCWRSLTVLVFWSNSKYFRIHNKKQVDSVLSVKMLLFVFLVFSNLFKIKWIHSEKQNHCSFKIVCGVRLRLRRSQSKPPVCTVCNIKLARPPSAPQAMYVCTFPPFLDLN